MPLTLGRNALLSQITRRQIGTRRLNFNNSFVEQATRNGGSILRMNWVGRLFGFLSRVIRTISVSARDIWGWAVQAWQGFTNINWNASDATLEQSIRQRNVQIAGAWGSTTGTAFGWIATAAIGAGIAMAIPVVGGSALAGLVVANVAGEAIDEIRQSLITSIRVTAQNLVANAGTSLYMRFRRAVKRLPLDTLTAIFGNENRARFIKNEWGKEGGPSWTIAQGFENATENRVNNEAFRAFLENAREEAWDSFVEGGFVVAQTIDEAIANSRAGAANILGETRTVLVTPDRDVPQESYALTGKRELLKTQIQETIHQHRSLYNKDVGEIVGMPVQDWVRAQPRMRSLIIVFQDKERPPFRHPDGRRVKSATYTIPEPKPGLSWRQIKSAAATYDWGKYRATANLKSRRQMAVYGSTPQNAERKLRKLLELSTDEIMTLSISEEKDRNPNVRKNPTRMFPAYVTFIIRRPTTDTSGRFITDRRWDEETKRYPLWTAQPPSDFVPMLQASRGE